MGNAGTKSVMIRDSSLSTEIFVSGSTRTEENNWDMLNSTISGSNRVKRDAGVLTLPLPANITILDNKLLNVPEAVDILWVLLYLNLFLATIITIQFSKYQ